MQLCAFDSQNEITFAHQAIKQHDYYCIECHEKVRVRRGLQRQPHFYHIKPNYICRMHGKGAVHLMLQQFIQTRFFPSAYLEYRFPEINRIADLVFLPKKLVFEIQCASITPEEIMGRNNDYSSIGYQVIWILHDQRYNQSKVSSAEYILRGVPHYYSNLNKHGQGIIYDHFSLFEGGVRKHRFPRLQVDLALPIEFHKNERFDKVKEQLPKQLCQRLIHWPLGFSGDCIDSCAHLIRKDSHFFHSELAVAVDQLLLKEKQEFWTNIKNTLYRYLVLPYVALVRLLLERFSR